jgi:hypothetical protein
MNQMFGADTGALRSAALELDREADRLDASAAELTRGLGSFQWLGLVAVRFSDGWNHVHRPALSTTSGFLREAAEVLRREAAQQERASSSAGGGVLLPPRPRRRDTWEFHPDLRPRRFDSHGSFRGDFVEAFWATGDGNRVWKEEIEIRLLDNGNYVVVIPGVTDLSENLGDIVDPRDGDVGSGAFHDGENADTARLMKYAEQEARDTNDSYDNPYAQRVRQAMEQHIPEGARVMLMGHSFGAYTAMELAGDPEFAASYYITHVVAAGADTDWKLKEIPSSTNALVLNNREDVVFRGEDSLVSDYKSESPNHLEIEFNGKSAGSSFWSAASGHDPAEYARFLTEAGDRGDLNAFIDSAGRLYSGDGTAISVKVPDVR